MLQFVKFIHSGMLSVKVHLNTECKEEIENHDLMKTAVFTFSNKKHLYFAKIVILA